MNHMKAPIIHKEFGVEGLGSSMKHMKAPTIHKEFGVKLGVEAK